MPNKENEIFNLGISLYTFNFFHFNEINFFIHGISSPENTLSLSHQKVFKKSKSVSLVSRFYGILLKMLCRFHQSLVFISFCNVALDDYPHAHFDQSRAALNRWSTKLIRWLSKHSRKTFVVKYNFCNSALRCRCAPGYIPNIFRTTFSLNNSGPLLL